MTTPTDDPECRPATRCSSGRRNEPCKSGVEPLEERDMEDDPLDRSAASSLSCVALPELVLLLGLDRVIRAARVVNPEIGEDSRLKTKALDVFDVRLVFEPEDLLAVLRNPPTRWLSSREVIAHPPPVGPLSRPYAVDLDASSYSWGRTRCRYVRGHVVRIVLEIGGKEADVGQAFEASRSVSSQPSGASTTSSSTSTRYGDSSARTPAHSAFWPMFFSLLTTRIRGSSSVARYAAVPSVDALFQITISRVAGEVRSSTFSTHFCAAGAHDCA